MTTPVLPEPFVAVPFARPPVRLVTLQFAWGGLFDTVADGPIHLNANYSDTSNETLCGIDMFAPDSPGWSRGGGVSGGSIVLAACVKCRAEKAERYPDLSVSGMSPFSTLDWSKP